MIRTSFGKRAAIITFFCLLVFSGVALTVGGIWLIALGGSFYYAITGIGYIAAAVLVLKRSKSACYLTGLLFLMTMLWALWESGLNYWALFPRLLVPAGLSIIAAFLLPSYLHGAKSRKQAYIAGSALSVAFVAFFIGAFFTHGEITPAGDVTFIESKSDNAPADWSAYGRTTEGPRYAPFNQVNRSTVKDLKLAWVYRTGDFRPGVDQNTPLAIDDVVYSCTPNGLITAIDADTGKARWKFDSFHLPRLATLPRAWLLQK